MVEKNEGFVSKPAGHSADQTVDRLKDTLRSRGVALFAVIDHSGEAVKAGV